MRTIW